MHDLFMEIVKPQHLLLYIFAYGLSATPTSYGVVRIIHRIDVEKRKVHSHTASHVWQTISMGSGILVFCLDFLKGLIPCVIASSLRAPIEVIALTGFFSVTGHCFSMWLKFFGGHGGATLAGVLVIVDFPAAIILLVINFLMLLLKRSAGMASVIAAVMSAIIVFFTLANKVVWLIVAAMVAVIILRHRARVT